MVESYTAMKKMTTGHGNQLIYQEYEKYPEWDNEEEAGSGLESEDDILKSTWSTGKRVELGAYAKIVTRVCKQSRLAMQYGK